MEDLFLFNTWYGGLMIFVFGSWRMKNTLKYTKRDTESYSQPFLSGMIGSIFIIASGLIIFFISLSN